MVSSSYAYRMTPYRRGLEAGREYHAALWAWSAAARASGEYGGRPQAPACPYTVASSIRSWQAGYRREALRKPKEPTA